MKPRAFNPIDLHVEAFAKQGAVLDGVWPLSDLDRLNSMLPSGEPNGRRMVGWHVQGERRTPAGAQPQCWLHLTVRTEVSMQCQRCLQVVSIPLAIERSFLFVAGEAEAAALDEESEDDVLALSRSLDMRLLLEDELLLSLPLVPRHLVCPEPLVPPVDPEAENDTEAPHPFAVLAALKPGGLPN